MMGYRAKVILAHKIDSHIRQLINMLGLNADAVSILKYRKPRGFEPELDNCHLNVCVQCNQFGGTSQYGWIIGQDKQTGFVEATFHTVWRAPDGELIDITPRRDGEKRVLFVPDPNRSIRFTNHEGRPAIISYDNFRMLRGKILSGLREIVIIPTSDFMYRHDLAKRTRALKGGKNGRE
jgi:hypothetical protein